MTIQHSHNRASVDYLGHIIVKNKVFHTWLCRTIVFAIYIIVISCNRPCNAVFKGAIDYYCLINNTFAVCTRDNVVVDLVRIIGPSDLSGDRYKQYISLLGYDFISDVHRCRFVDWVDYNFQNDKYSDLYKKWRFHSDNVRIYDAVVNDPSYEDFMAKLRKAGKYHTSKLAQPWARHGNEKYYRWIMSNKKVLDALVNASRKRHYFNPLAKDMPFIDARVAIEALIARAMLAIGEDRFGEAWEDLLACSRLVYLAKSGSSSICELVNTYLCRMKQLFRAYNILLGHVHKIPSSQLNHIRQELSRLPEIDGRIRLLDCGERYICLNGIYESSVGMGLGMLSLNSYSQDNANHIREKAMQRLNDCMDLMITAVKEPTYQKCMKILRPLEAKLYAEAQKHHPVGNVTPDMLVAYCFLDAELAHLNMGYVRMDAECSMMKSLLEVALALEAYHRSQKEFPEHLDVLVPSYLTSLPSDIFNDKDIKYIKLENGYRLYSVGDNGIDDTTISGKILESQVVHNDDIVITTWRQN